MQTILPNLATGVIFFLLGIATTHVYYRKGTRELRTIVDKLPSHVADALQTDVRTKLTVQELNDLIYQKTIDEEAGEAGDPLPYRACPLCGNPTLRGTTVDGPRDHVFFVKSCPACGWQTYSE